MTTNEKCPTCSGSTAQQHMEKVDLMHKAEVAAMRKDYDIAQQRIEALERLLLMKTDEANAMRPVCEAAERFTDKSSDEEWFPDEEWTSLCDAIATWKGMKVGAAVTKSGQATNRSQEDGLHKSALTPNTRKGEG